MKDAKKVKIRWTPENEPGASNALRPDAQAFDEVRIRTIPRFKESELSGSEWRISAEVELYRKGELITSQVFGNIQAACGFAYSVYVSAQDSALGYFAGDGTTCDQEGCAEDATVRYRLKKDYCSGGGGCGQEKEIRGPVYRRFCHTHSQRGDQSLDDSDRNYEKA